MINLFNTHIENLSIHRVGNKSRNEAIFLSDNPYGLNDEIMPLLKENKHFKEIMETKKVNNEVKNSLIVSIKLTKSQSDLLKQRRKIE